MSSFRSSTSHDMRVSTDFSNSSDSSSVNPSMLYSPQTSNANLGRRSYSIRANRPLQRTPTITPKYKTLHQFATTNATSQRAVESSTLLRSSSYDKPLLSTKPFSYKTINNSSSIGIAPQYTENYSNIPTAFPPTTGAESRPTQYLSDPFLNSSTSGNGSTFDELAIKSNMSPLLHDALRVVITPTRTVVLDSQRQILQQAQQQAAENEASDIHDKTYSYDHISVDLPSPLSVTPFIQMNGNSRNRNGAMATNSVFLSKSFIASFNKQIFSQRVSEDLRTQVENHKALGSFYDNDVKPPKKLNNDIVDEYSTEPVVQPLLKILTKAEHHLAQAREFFKERNYRTLKANSEMSYDDTFWKYFALHMSEPGVVDMKWIPRPARFQHKKPTSPTKPTVQSRILKRSPNTAPQHENARQTNTTGPSTQAARTKSLKKTAKRTTKAKAKGRNLFSSNGKYRKGSLSKWLGSISRHSSNTGAQDEEGLNDTLSLSSMEQTGMSELKIESSESNATESSIDDPPSADDKCTPTPIAERYGDSNILNANVMWKDAIKNMFPQAYSWTSATAALRMDDYQAHYHSVHGGGGPSTASASHEQRVDQAAKSQSQALFLVTITDSSIPAPEQGGLLSQKYAMASKSNQEYPTMTLLRSSSLSVHNDHTKKRQYTTQCLVLLCLDSGDIKKPTPVASHATSSSQVPQKGNAKTLSSTEFMKDSTEDTKCYFKNSFGPMGQTQIPHLTYPTEPWACSMPLHASNLQFYKHPFNRLPKTEAETTRYRVTPHIRQTSTWAASPSPESVSNSPKKSHPYACIGTTSSPAESLTSVASRPGINHFATTAPATKPGYKSHLPRELPVPYDNPPNKEKPKSSRQFKMKSNVYSENFVYRPRMEAIAIAKRFALDFAQQYNEYDDDNLIIKMLEASAAMEMSDAEEEKAENDTTNSDSEGEYNEAVENPQDINEEKEITQQADKQQAIENISEQNTSLANNTIANNFEHDSSASSARSTESVKSHNPIFTYESTSSLEQASLKVYGDIEDLKFSESSATSSGPDLEGVLQVYQNAIDVLESNDKPKSETITTLQSSKALSTMTLGILKTCDSEKSGTTSRVILDTPPVRQFLKPNNNGTDSSTEQEELQNELPAAPTVSNITESIGIKGKGITRKRVSAIQTMTSKHPELMGKQGSESPTSPSSLESPKSSDEGYYGDNEASGINDASPQALEPTGKNMVLDLSDSSISMLPSSSSTDECFTSEENTSTESLDYFTKKRDEPRAVTKPAQHQQDSQAGPPNGSDASLSSSNSLARAPSTFPALPIKVSGSVPYTGSYRGPFGRNRPRSYVRPIKRNASHGVSPKTITSMESYSDNTKITINGLKTTHSIANQLVYNVGNQALGRSGSLKQSGSKSKLDIHRSKSGKHVIRNASGVPISAKKKLGSLYVHNAENDQESDEFIDVTGSSNNGDSEVERSTMEQSGPSIATHNVVEPNEICDENDFPLVPRTRRLQRERMGLRIPPPSLPPLTEAQSYSHKADKESTATANTQTETEDKIREPSKDAEVQTSEPESEHEPKSTPETTKGSKRSKSEHELIMSTVASIELPKKSIPELTQEEKSQHEIIVSTAASIVPQKQSISELIQEEKDRTVMVMSSTASVAPAKTSFSPMSFLLGRSHSRDKREELLAPAEPAIQRAITPASVLYDDELNQFTSYYDQTAHTRSNTLIYQSGPQRVKVDHSAETAQNQAANQTIPVQRSIANVPTRQQQKTKNVVPAPRHIQVHPPAISDITHPPLPQPPSNIVARRHQQAQGNAANQRKALLNMEKGHGAFNLFSRTAPRPTLQNAVDQGVHQSQDNNYSDKYKSIEPAAHDASTAQIMGIIKPQTGALISQAQGKNEAVGSDEAHTRTASQIVAEEARKASEARRQKEKHISKMLFQGTVFASDTESEATVSREGSRSLSIFGLRTPKSRSRYQTSHLAHNDMNKRDTGENSETRALRFRRKIENRPLPPLPLPVNVPMGIVQVHEPSAVPHTRTSNAQQRKDKTEAPSKKVERKSPAAVKPLSNSTAIIDESEKKGSSFWIFGRGLKKNKKESVKESKDSSSSTKVYSLKEPVQESVKQIYERQKRLQRLGEMKVQTAASNGNLQSWIKDQRIQKEEEEARRQHEFNMKWKQMGTQHPPRKVEQFQLQQQQQQHQLPKEETKKVSSHQDNFLQVHDKKQHGSSKPKRSVFSGNKMFRFMGGSKHDQGAEEDSESESEYVDVGPDIYNSYEIGKGALQVGEYARGAFDNRHSQQNSSSHRYNTHGRIGGGSKVALQLLVGRRELGRV